MRQEQKRFLIGCLVVLFNTIIKHYVCIDYLACQSKKLSEIPVGSGGGYEYGEKSLNRILGIRIPFFY